MFRWFATRYQRRRTAQNLYGSIVALSRAPAIYTEFHVPDTVEGRFEVLVLHMYVFLERLRGEGDEETALAQELVDLFFADMDTTSRELGVGDLSVPKKMRGLASAFTQRMQTYDSAMESRGLDSLTRALNDTIYVSGDSAKGDAKALAGHVRRLRKGLSKRSIHGLLHADSVDTGVHGDAR